MPDATPSPDALRMRRYRERQRKGAVVVPVETPLQTIEEMIDAGLVDESTATDLGQVGKALLEAVRQRLGKK